MSMFGEIAEEHTWTEAADMALSYARFLYAQAKQAPPLSLLRAQLHGSVTALAVLSAEYRRKAREVG